MGQGWGEALDLVFALGFFTLIAAVALGRRRRPKPKMAVDGPIDEPYRVYTREFDLEVGAEEFRDRLFLDSPDYARGWISLDERRGEMAFQQANEMFAETRRDIQALGLSSSSGSIAEHLAGSAVVVLVDQSGSIEGPKAAVTATVARHFIEVVGAFGGKSELLGFSTVGWHGGNAALKWSVSGKERRPGRLCALLHLIYKDWSEIQLSPTAWRAIFDPNIYRENVDGEALEWAARRLAERPERHKALVIISDGAPVDDATLLHNGPSYLSRHVQTVIADLQGRDDLRLAAIGIDHRVEEWYGLASFVSDAADVAPAIYEILAGLSQPARSAY
jgi:cobaltochelatase CobT